MVLHCSFGGFYATGRLSLPRLLPFLIEDLARSVFARNIYNLFPWLSTFVSGLDPKVIHHERFHSSRVGACLTSLSSFPQTWGEFSCPILKRWDLVILFWAIIFLVQYVVICFCSLLHFFCSHEIFVCRQFGIKASEILFQPCSEMEGSTAFCWLFSGID